MSWVTSGSFEDEDFREDIRVRQDDRDHFSGSDIQSVMTAEEALAQLTKPPAEVVAAAKAIPSDFAGAQLAHFALFLSRITGGAK
jgi:hypothetical protein